VTVIGAVKSRMIGLAQDLRAAATLRRTEKSLNGYLMRLFIMGMLLVVLPLKMLIQLGIVGFVLAALKVAVAVGLVALVLAAAFAVGEIARRRKGAGGPETAP
jgi:hypothetical protein